MLEKMEGIGGRRTSKSGYYFYAPEWNHFFYGVPLQLTFSCRFDFAGFPFDSHECPMEFGERLKQTKDVTHCYSIRSNLKKMGPLQFCLPALLKIHRNHKQKEFLKSCEGLLR